MLRLSWILCALVVVPPTLAHAASLDPVERTAKLAAEGDTVSGRIRAAVSVRQHPRSGIVADGGIASDPDALVRINETAEIQIYIELTEFRPEYVLELEKHGVRVEIVLPEFHIVQGWVPIGSLDGVRSLSFVSEVREPDYAHPHAIGAVATEGDAVLRANAARTRFGASGAGVKVGVISNGVQSLADSQSSGDLPFVDVLRSGSGDEGTAMLEIVHDLAPGATLAFSAVATSVEMVQAINALRNAGARVIVDDFSFFGEPKFQDGMVAQTIRSFAQAGGVYVGAAGNNTKRHYRAIYRRVGGAPSGWAGFHNYSSDGVTTGNKVTLPPGCGMLVVLQWNNPWGAARDDFDLFIKRASDGLTVASSLSLQNGTHNPFEAVAVINTGATPAAVVVVVAEFARRTGIEITLDYFAVLTCAAADQDFLQFATPSQSLTGNNASLDMLSVAALGVDTPLVAQTYSSIGPHDVFFPTFERRLVPTISAIDCVRTRTGQLGHFPDPFCGTSAAAPHVAGIAALLLEAAPWLSAQQARDVLTGTAIDLGPPGFDVTYGAGRIDAVNALSEFRGLGPFVAGFYEDVLGRQAEPAGRAAWMHFLQDHCDAAGFAAMGTAFFDSLEFRAVRSLTLDGLVTALYRSFLDRDPEPTGLSYWAQRFRGQRTLLASQGFLHSAEFQESLRDRSDRTAVTTVVTRFYMEILGRAADPAEVTAWVDYVVATGDLEGVAVGFITSPEFEARPLTFRAFVTILYRALLGREPDAGGLDSWEGVIRRDLVGVIETGFAPAPEFLSKLPVLCGT
jgi:subtilisin family serine protease